MLGKAVPCLPRCASATGERPQGDGTSSSPTRSAGCFSGGVHPSTVARTAGHESVARPSAATRPGGHLGRQRNHQGVDKRPARPSSKGTSRAAMRPGPAPWRPAPDRDDSTHRASQPRRASGPKSCSRFASRHAGARLVSLAPVHRPERQPAANAASVAQPLTAQNERGVRDQCIRMRPQKARNPQKRTSKRLNATSDAATSPPF